VSSNSVCNHARDKQIRFPLRGRIELHSVPLPLLISILSYSGDQKAPSLSLSWIDSISSSDVQNDSPPFLLSTQGFDTSESIALSSTEGFMKNSQAGERNPTDIRPEFVQRVPQLVRKLYGEHFYVAFFIHSF